MSNKAANYHGISHQMANDGGRPLKDVLVEFMSDAQKVIETHGGKLIAHHLEFDAGIIANEMISCGMSKSLELFEIFTRTGACTMDPAIGRWVLQCIGKDFGPSTRMNTLSLKTLVKHLIPEDQKLLENLHSAGTDSLLVLKIVRAIKAVSG